MTSNEYLTDINLKETDEDIVSLRLFAKENNIPIMAYESSRFIQQIILMRQVKNILEIGTAIGYSTLTMIKGNQDILIDTIERDPKMIQLAENNFSLYDTHHQITLLKGDALTLDLGLLNQTYDLILIDAAKAQSQRFFTRFEPFLSHHGVIITDNLLFHGMIGTRQPSRNLNQLLRKIDTFSHELVTNNNYDTFIYPIGDGLSVSIKTR